MLDKEYIKWEFPYYTLFKNSQILRKQLCKLLCKNQLKYNTMQSGNTYIRTSFKIK